VLAGLALLLTVIGVYGVICCSAAQQTREIAVRVAFGAQPRDILSHILKQTLRMSAAGIALAIAAYFPMVRLLRGIFYGIDATPYWSLILSSAGIAALAILVSLIPARRTARTDAAVVLHTPPRW
jgi:putative ABC transport system permease protein